MYQVYLHSKVVVLFMACLLPEGAVSELNIHLTAKVAFKACVSYVCLYKGALGTAK